ncbi:MAG: hypothetical protein M3069_20930 [Chloroflexota bacterium]|nr:hypothetical protein [Chloroflexota bacterium]
MLHGIQNYPASSPRESAMMASSPEHMPVVSMSDGSKVGNTQDEAPAKAADA